VIGQLSHGGAERQLYELARHLPSEGIKPTVICLSEADDPYGRLLRQAGIEVVTMSRRMRVEPGRIGRLIRVLREKRVHLAHSYLFGASAYTSAAAWWLGLPFLPAVRSFGQGRAFVLRTVDRIVLRRGRLVLANSRDVAAWVEKGLGVPGAQIRVVSNGLDLPRFTCIPDMKAGRDSCTVVGSISLFKPQKRIHFLLEVAGNLKSRGRRFRFRLLGDGAEWERCRESRDKMGLQDCVELPGRTDDVASELAGLHIFVLASDREGMPNAVMEAMAAGRPVVATRVPGTAEIVEDGVTGLLVPPDDVDRFAGALETLMDDPGLAGSLGRAGRRRAVVMFPLERMVQETVQVYRELLGRGLQKEEREEQGG
ncbi:MAG: glycosyltransferase, partial [Acidobacteriota bacterium]